MLVSYNWLKDFTAIEESPEVLAGKLTMAGIEISSMDKLKDDCIYSAEITPNRPDLLCAKGIAREAACLTQSDFFDPLNSMPAVNPPEGGIGLEIRRKDLCLEYNAALIKNVEVKVSDKKITRRLAALGLRPVNNVVDITNYFLLGWGQPMHAFDYDKIEGGGIIVRLAQKGEKLPALDGKEYELDQTMLIIADAKKPIAIAGIIGGVNAEISTETKNILLECASFDPVSIRKTARKLGIATDSSYRFERGVPVALVDETALKAAALIQKKAGGEISQNVRVCGPKAKKFVSILRFSEVERILGLGIHPDKIRKMLVSLGFIIESESPAYLEVASPYFREDVKREIDLIEEVARLYGYENLPATIAKVSSRRIENYKSLSQSIDEAARFTVKKKIRGALSSCGLSEIITYSMISSRETEIFDFKPEEIVKLQKALSSEQEIMRPTLFCGLLRALSWNLNRQADSAGFFELGDIFINQRHKFAEKLYLGIGLCGKKYTHDWKNKPKEVSFYDLKGILENFFEVLGIRKIEFSECKNTFFFGGAEAEIIHRGKVVGRFGRLNKRALSFYDIDKDVYAAEVYLEDILEDICFERKFEPIAKFPAVTRDLAVIVKSTLSARDIINAIKKTQEHLIKEVTLFDVYEGRQIPAGCLSLAFSIVYQADDRTLIDEEVDEIQTRIQKVLVESLKAQIR